MKSAAEMFLGKLDDAKRQNSSFAFTDESREHFRYTPQKRSGLAFKEMDATQRAAAEKLLLSALSEAGQLKAMQIMTLEGILADLEKRPDYRDPGKYHISIFGKPGDGRKRLGIDQIHFGWTGGIQRGEAWYYRIQGPTFLMEAANTQNQANHIHATWRDFQGDFGRDMLSEHYHQHGNDAKEH